MKSLAALCAGLALLGTPFCPAGEPAKHPARLATQARFDLLADAAVGELTDGRWIRGDGTVNRMNWLPQTESPRGYTTHVRINHLSWAEVALRFTPAKSGTVTLTLMGPWEEAAKGVLYKQEVLWDDLRVEGTHLENGGFEKGTAGWQGRGAVDTASDKVRAAEGQRFARTWHDATLATTLRVAGGVPVTLRLSVRAALPPGFQDMKRLAGHNTPAHRAAKRFLRGANLGNYLEAPPGQDWGARYGPADFKHIRAEGFDHVRLPVAWHHYAGPAPEYKLGGAIFAKVDALVDEAKRHGLNVIVDLHHFDEFTKDPPAHKAKFLALWRQLAAHYATAPEGVAFELLNEPKDAATTAAMNRIYAEAVRAIRKTNPRRTLFIGPGKWNQASELVHLRLPDDDNLIVTIHCYDPFYFTHQGASWAGGDVKVTGIRYPGPPAKPLQPPAGVKLNSWVKDWLERYNSLPAERNPCGPAAFRGAVRLAKEWSDYYGRPVHVGEFGCYIKADPASRARFYRDFREALDEAGLGWAVWDWKAGFRYWDPQADRPAPGMREALFPQKKPH